MGCGRSTNDASVSSAYTASNVTTSVKRVSGRGKPTYRTAAMITALDAPASRKRASRSGGMPALSCKLGEGARLTCAGGIGPGEERERRLYSLEGLLLLQAARAGVDAGCVLPALRCST